MLWGSGLRLLIGEFHQFLTELSAYHKIVAGYHFTSSFKYYFSENSSLGRRIYEIPSLI